VGREWGWRVLPVVDKYVRTLDVPAEEVFTVTDIM